jgi:hypothetical protein
MLGRIIRGNYGSVPHVQYFKVFILPKGCVPVGFPWIFQGLSTSIRRNFGNAYKHEKLDLNSPWSSFVIPFKLDQWKHDITPILLGHAQLYVFAQMYMIVKLKERALGRLCEYLVQLEIYPLTRGPIIELLHYAYNTDNITDREEDVSIDPCVKWC